MITEHVGSLTLRARTGGGGPRLLFGAYLIAIALPSVTQIEGGDSALKHLPGVAVIVESTAPEIRRFGVDPTWLKEQARAVLERAAVPLLSEADAFSSTRQPLLVIRLQSIRLGTAAEFVWHLSVAVHQKTVTLGPAPDTLLTQSWAASHALGVTSGRLLKNSVRETLESKLAEFVRAWKSQR